MVTSNQLLQLGGEALVASLAERAQVEGSAVTVTIAASFYIGTQAQELSGDAKFNIPIAVPDATASRYCLPCKFRKQLYS